MVIQPTRGYRFRPIVTCEMCGADAARFDTFGMRLNRSQGLKPGRVRGVAVSIARCRDCGLLFPDPQPVPESLADHYEMPGEEYWTDARSKAPLSPELVARFRALRRRFAYDRPSVLDVGVGSGFSARALIEAGFDFQGFEPIPQFRELALESLGLEPDRILLGGVETADYPDGSFDLVNFGAVLEHLYEPGEALSKAVRWLRPNGLIVLEVPSANWLIGRLINFYYRCRLTSLVTNTSPMHSPFHLYEFTPQSFSCHGERCGYVVDECRIAVGRDPNLPVAIQRLLRPIMRLTGTGLMLEMILRKT